MGKLRNNKNILSNISEMFSPSCSWIVEDIGKDDASQVDNKHIIGRVTGQFFVPGGTSRNGRFYPESLWERVTNDKDVLFRMNERKMFGTIGHDEEPVSEQQLRNGEVSHIVTKLWIDVDDFGKKKGMGEALILGTPSGHNLNTYLRAGCKLNTSSRASGKFLETNNSEGVPIVDEESFIFETFDFVLDPGFLEANPQLVERLNSENQTEEEKENGMGVNLNAEKILQESMRTIMDSRDSAQKQLDAAISEKTDLEKKYLDLNEKWEKTKNYESVVPILEKLGVSAEYVSRVGRVVEDLGFKDFSQLVQFTEKLSKEDVNVISNSNVVENAKELEEFRSLAPDPKTGVEISEKLSKRIKSYMRLGSPEHLRNITEKLEKLEKELKPLGSTREIREALELSRKELNSFAKLGTRREIEEALRSSLVLLREYRKCGTPNRIKEALTKANKMADFLIKAGGKKRIIENYRKIDAMKKAKRENLISTVSERLSFVHNAPVNEVRDMVESLGAKKTHKILSKVSEKAKRDSYLNESLSSGQTVESRSSMLDNMYSQAVSKSA